MSTPLDEAVARLRAWHQSDDHQHEDPDAFNADLGALLKDHAGLREKLSTSRTTCAYCEAVHELPCTFDDIRAHVEKCPKHPMAALRAELERLRKHPCREVQGAENFGCRVETPLDLCAACSQQVTLERLRERDFALTQVLARGLHAALVQGKRASVRLDWTVKAMKDALALLKEEP